MQYKHKMPPKIDFSVLLSAWTRYRQLVYCMNNTTTCHNQVQYVKSTMLVTWYCPDVYGHVMHQTETK